MSGAGTNRVNLKSSEFRALREASWHELEGMLDRVERKGVRILSAAELERLPLLYRAALSSLSVARAIALDRNLRLYLESLALRGFIAVHGPCVSPLAGIARFLAHDLPAAVRAVRWHFVLSLLLVAAGTLAGFLLVEADPSWFGAIVPGWLTDGRGMASSRAELLSGEIFAPWPGVTQSFLAMADFLFTHNTLIGIVTFSLGIAAGVPTAILLFEQGLTLGAFLALHHERGLTVDFIGWVSIHGTTEIGAILLCGAGGLLIAEKLLFPGRLGRLESLAGSGRVAARVAIGAMLMFFLAGILEGGFRQLIASTGARYAIGTTIGLLWLLYFTRAGRERAP